MSAVGNHSVTTSSIISRNMSCGAVVSNYVYINTHVQMVTIRSGGSKTQSRQVATSLPRLERSSRIHQGLNPRSVNDGHHQPLLDRLPSNTPVRPQLSHAASAARDTARITSAAFHT